MQPDQRLIDKYHDGQCTPAEALLVMRWLLENENDTALEKDWAASPEKGEYPAEYQAEMLSAIQAQISKQQLSRPPLFHISIAKWAVAASILLVAAIALLQINKDRQNRSIAASLTAHNPAQNRRLAHITAPAGKVSKITLSDGSTVILEPNAVLQYDSSDYNEKDRTLQLEGQALFTVAAEKEKPFSVNANGYSTIALGTSFMVSTQTLDGKPGEGIRVRLYSGKVLVRRTGAENANTPDGIAGPDHTPALDRAPALDRTAAPDHAPDIYLHPGEELVADKLMHQPVVARFDSMNTANGSLAAGSTKRPSVSKTLILTQKEITRSGDTITFNNAPLASVLDLLHKRYHVAIQYDKPILSDAYFTGQILPGDAIDLILRSVTRMNNLTLLAAGDGFIIK